MTILQRLTRPLRAFWADHASRRTMTIIFATIGVVLLLIGLYTFVVAQRRYDELVAGLNHIIQDLGMPTDPNDPSAMLLAQATRDRNDAEKERWSGVMYAGLGIMALGAAYFVSPPRESSIPPAPNALDSTAANQE